MRKPDWYDLLFIAILLAFTSICFGVISAKGLSNDELAHISAGYSYIKTGDYRMNVEHPPLIKLLSGFALLPLNPKLPIEHASWPARLEWVFGDRFFFSANTNADAILIASRTPIIFIGALLLFFVYLFARALYGPWAGIIASFFTALDPLVIGMSTVVHTDIGVTTFGFMTVYFFWKFYNKRTWKHLILTGLCLGLAISSKFTGLYFIGILIVLSILSIIFGRSDDVLSNQFSPKKIFSEESKQLVVFLLIVLSIGALIFFSTYLFSNLQYFIMGMKDVTIHSATGHRSFLAGAFSQTGFWYYFPVAFLIKTPLPTLIFLLFGTMFFFKSFNKQYRNELFLLVPAGIYLALFMLNRINIGVRHILPIYPFLLVFASNSTRLKSKAWTVILLALIAWLSWNAYAVYPHYLSSFNEIIGGPNHGHEWLIDSNIDWGQDLKGLASWLSNHGNPVVRMAYFGLDDREYRNIIWEELKCGPQPGLIAISVNRLVGFDLEDSKCSAWLLSRKPLEKIGYSIFLYNITEESIVSEREAYCQEKCKEKCHLEKQVFISSEYSKKCKCHCTGAQPHTPSTSNIEGN